MSHSPVKLPAVQKIISLSLICSWLVLICVAERCHDGEREALTKFRNGLHDPFNRLSSWTTSNLSDCCRWRGISCNKKTGYVTKLDLRNPYPRSLIQSEDIFSKYGYWNLSGQLAQSLLELKHLSYLDLSFNSFEGNSIPAFIGSLSELRYLNLSYAGFQGIIPPQLGNLSKLEYLDVSSSRTAVLAIDNLKWLGNMHNLRYLDMNGVDLSREDDSWLHMINKLPLLVGFRCKSCRLSNFPPTLPSINFTSLRVLDLSNNGFQRVIPNWLANVSNLVSLDLSYNVFNTTFPYWLPKKLHFLQELKLAAAYLSGNCSKALEGSWEKMMRIDLSRNQLYGEIPMSIGNMTSLVELDLSGNQIHGPIPKSISNLHQLEILDLSENSIDGGPTLDQLCQLKKLKVLQLPECNLTGSIPPCLGEFSSLQRIDLRSNGLHGALPKSIGQLAQLSDLYLGNNSLSGPLSEDHFKYLSNLLVLDISSNSLTLQFQNEWSPPFQLRIVKLSSCRLGPKFPAWLKNQKYIFQELDISNTSISDNIPEWFWDITPNVLNLSRNMIEAKLPNPFKVGVGAMVDLSYNSFWGPIPSMLDDVFLVDISNNNFSGPLPHNIDQALPGLQIFFASNNQISGTIPLSIGKMDLLLLLDLSNNSLSGVIPPAIGNCTQLFVLDLSENFLQGEIPKTIGSLNWVKYLHLEENNLSGEIPASIHNCSYLETVDLGENRISGHIPARIGDGSRLRKLRLRSNLLSGIIPQQLAEVKSLHVLDLAHNNLTGSIPPIFGKMFARRNQDEDDKLWNFVPADIHYYVDNLFVSRKGQMQKYTKTLSLVTSFDLSNNNLEGRIPEELTNISDLRLLNLAHNNFTGNMPKNIGNLILLESLDLSSNKLSGSIPQSLSLINSLSYLNLSYNNLSGRIPSGPQLQVLDYPSIYWGNPELCGPPLPDKCPGDTFSGDGDRTSDGRGRQGNQQDGSEETDMEWVYAGIGPGFAVGCSGVFLLLIFKKSWRYAFFKFVDSLSAKFSW